MRFAFFCGLVAALLCLTQNANAQYARKGADLVSQNGFTLSDQEIISIVGNDVFDQTVIGARKQYRVGGNLIRSGAITLGAGLLSALSGAALLVSNGPESPSSRYYQYQERPYYERDEAAYTGGALLLAGGYAAMFVGGALLEAGVPLRIIGQSRLNWVENNYNDYSRNVSLHVGAAPHGVGLTLRF